MRIGFHTGRGERTRSIIHIAMHCNNRIVITIVLFTGVTQNLVFYSTVFFPPQFWTTMNIYAIDIHVQIMYSCTIHVDTFSFILVNT